MHFILRIYAQGHITIWNKNALRKNILHIKAAHSDTTF